MPFALFPKSPGDKSQARGEKLYSENKHRFAELEFRHAVARRAQALGDDHISTLFSHSWLAASLYAQEKYDEAEEHSRQVLLGREKTLGRDHKHTLNSRHGLAISLYDQGKYEAAEECFWQALLEREKVLGRDHENTLNSQYWLSASLFRRGKYEEAEEHSRQVLLGREKTLGQDHEYTLDSRYWLAETLYVQEKYKEAEEHSRQALPGLERLHDHNDGVVLRCKKLLSISLSRQKQQHAKAMKNVLQSTESDSVKDRSLDNTSANGRRQAIILPRKLSMITADGSAQELAQHLDEFFVNHQSEGPTYKDDEISTISRLLAHEKPQWSRCPRTYIVLRTIECLHLLDDILASGFTDYWFPVTLANLPTILRPDQKSGFVNAQRLILTKSLGLEKGVEGHHCYFGPDEVLPFEKQRILGRGGFGQVDEVLSMISYQKYARKRVLRRTILRGRKPEHLKSFITEIETLKRLQHKHVVQFVGSYSDTKYLALLMRPVAEMDLAIYLARPDISSRLGELRTFFGCLAAALDFLHTQSVRHKDIKPENILVDRGNVLFTDFGLCHDFADARASTTVSMVNGMTPRYCAPEVALFEPRNKSSDIWSLGVVYLEMLVTLKGLTVEYMREYFSEHGTQQLFVRTNREALVMFLECLEKVGSRGDNRVISWVGDMLQEDSRKRPHTSLLLTTINDMPEDEHGSKVFCGICCLQGGDDSDSDFSDL